MNWRRNLLWIDCSGGAVVGVAMFALAGWLSELYRLPKDFLYLMGFANLAYAAYSFSLARRATRPLALITVLALANGAWGVLCLVWAFGYAESASVLGLLHLVVEGVFVGGLGIVEWRCRELLLDA
ncbi:MAG: hypothetical protein AAGE94_04980 [Acidobacteriota bacterium]